MCLCVHARAQEERFAELKLTLKIENIFFFHNRPRGNGLEQRRSGAVEVEMGELAVMSLAICPAACPEHLRINKTLRDTIT